MKIEKIVSQIIIAIFGGLVGSIISFWSIGNMTNESASITIALYAIIFIMILMIVDFLFKHLKKRLS